MIDKEVDINKLSAIDILKKCILVRHIKDIEEKKQLLYKYKEYDKNGNIIKQRKIICPIEDTIKTIKI